MAPRILPPLAAIAIALGAASLPSPCLGGEEALEAGVTRDLPFVAGEEVGDKQRLDLYVPQGEGPWPALMWIHGGAWAVGHRRQEEALARRLAERGIAVAAVDHRASKALWIDPALDTGVEHPAHVEDCAAAFAWLRANAAAHRLDPERLFVGGFSSGAHLAALLATDPKYLAAHELEPSSLRAAVAVGGAYDLVAYYALHREKNGEEMAEQHVLDVFGRREGALADASPTTHLGKTQVPMLVISEQGTREYTKRFEDAVARAGISHIRFRHFADRTHRTIGPRMANAGPDAVRDAIVAYLRGEGAHGRAVADAPSD